METSFFDPCSTVEGELPPWEVAKAYALHIVIGHVAEQLDTPAHELPGSRVDDYIAKQIVLKGGGHPEARGVRKVIARCKQPDWYPGQRTHKRAGAGRQPTYSEHQNNEVARVGMDLKRKLIRPTPRRVKARLSKSIKNPENGRTMSTRSI